MHASHIFRPMPRTKSSKRNASKRASEGELDPATAAERANYVFFWKPHELEAGWASQWWADKSFTSADGSVEYKTAEHWMMGEKARLFDDEEVRQRILTTGDPKKVKALGRKVGTFY